MVMVGLGHSGLDGLNRFNVYGYSLTYSDINNFMVSTDLKYALYK